jgi:hypothetical protein
MYYITQATGQQRPNLLWMKRDKTVSSKATRGGVLSQEVHQGIVFRIFWGES